MATFTPTHGTVTTELCPLHYWSLGTGPLILFVPGGNGHGRQFNPMLTALAPLGFTAATFDRRQMSSSQPPPGVPHKMMSPPQQARDIRAVITALGFAKAHAVFGSSSGGIFTLQFAHDFPSLAEHVIAHEAPLTNLLPAAMASEVYERFLELMGLWRAGEREQAVQGFAAGLIGYGDEGLPKTATPEPGNGVNFWEYEMPTLTGYVPNLWRVRENGTSVGVMRGRRSRDAFFALAVDELAKVLGCPMMMVPGHHQAFEVETEEFLPCFLEMLKILEERKGGKK